MLIDGLESCGLLVDYSDVFIRCLDSHSDGTHSLQRIHWWANYMIHFSKSVPMKKQTHLHIAQPKGEYIFMFWWTILFSQHQNIPLNMTKHQNSGEKLQRNLGKRTPCCDVSSTCSPTTVCLCKRESMPQWCNEGSKTQRKMWWEDMSGRWWQGHHYPKQTSERGSVCERGRNTVCVCTYSLTPHFQMRMSALHCKRFVHPRTPYMKARYLPRLNYECVTMFMQVCACVCERMCGV